MCKNEAVQAVYTAGIAQCNQIKVAASSGSSCCNSVFTSCVAHILAKLAFACGVELCWHRTVSYACLVSLENSKNVVKIVRTDSAACSSSRSARSSGTYIRICSRINVEHCALCAFKKNVFLAEFPHLLCKVYTHLQKLFFVFVKIVKVFFFKVSKLFCPVQVCKPKSVAVRFFAVCDSYSASSCSNRTFAGRISVFVHLAVSWKNKVRAVRNKYSAFPVHAVVFYHLKLFEQGFRVDYHSCSKKNLFV